MTPAATDMVQELHLEAQFGDVITYNMVNLLSALGITDPTRVIVETDGVRKAIVTIYPENPLSDIRAVTLNDLIMDRRGYITVGRYHNGRPVKKRLFDPTVGRAQRFLCFGTTGAGKSRVLQMDLIAEKANGIVSWACDLKGGQSIPEARGRIDWFGDTAEIAMLMLQAAVWVVAARTARYSAMGRNAFLRNRPDPLLHVSIEEANRLLDKGSPYRAQAAQLILELGRTGGSVGVSIRLNAQASHLEELGGSDTLRAMLKDGEVTLLRWSSSMMRQLVADGLLPSTSQLMPIPRTLAEARLISQFDDMPDEEEAPGTQGMAYLLSSPYPTSLMRHWRIGSREPLPGLDPEIIALYGEQEPPRLEAASHAAAGDAYTYRDDPDQMAHLCAGVLTDEEARKRGRLSGGATDDPDDTEPAPGPTLLNDRVCAALYTAADPMDATAVLAAVNADGGRTVRLGSVRNALTALAGDGVIDRAAGGTYTMPGRA